MVAKVWPGADQPGNYPIQISARPNVASKSGAMRGDLDFIRPGGALSTPLLLRSNLRTYPWKNDLNIKNYKS